MKCLFSDLFDYIYANIICSEIMGDLVNSELQPEIIIGFRQLVLLIYSRYVSILLQILPILCRYLIYSEFIKVADVFRVGSVC
jgi:hypothetical protein